VAIKKLLKLIKTVNIADTIAKKQGGENELMMIGQDVIKGFDVDWDSMDEWKEDIDKGLELKISKTTFKTNFNNIIL